MSSSTLLGALRRSSTFGSELDGGSTLSFFSAAGCSQILGHSLDWYANEAGRFGVACGKSASVA